MAAEFLNSLIVREVDDSVFEVAVEPFSYRSDLAKQVFTVPIGFYTDFASVPRLGAIYAFLGDCAHEPAVIHDWLYYSAIVSRDLADTVLFEAMGVIGVPSWRKWPIYWGVRIGGWHAWNEHRKNGHPEAGKFRNTTDIQNKGL